MRDAYLETTRNQSGRMGDHNIFVYEPCNTASNLAYYHAVLRVCEYGDNWSIDQNYQRGMKRTFAMLGAQSAFFHESMTNVGIDWDNQAISLVA